MAGQFDTKGKNKKALRLNSTLGAPKIVTLDELAETLPNGFHDAHVACVLINYVARVAVLDLTLWVGTEDDPEARRAAQLTLTGLQFCVIDPPDPNYPYAAAKPLWTSDVVPPPAGARLPMRNADAFVSSFFVNEWNAFIHFAALDAGLK